MLEGLKERRNNLDEAISDEAIMSPPGQGSEYKLISEMEKWKDGRKENPI